ncbi:MAG TPA: RNA 2',3'-cyclic phosphodiesterase [Thermoplasmata archaeon]|jgi:2'-5' RNA ligase|nr:RNA 2',3'-cyclic phosphodiesterase [Thermoplasmata archaeon]
MRAFVAVEVPPPSSEAHRGAAPDHLTLLFLGEIPRERVGPIAEALSPVAADATPFDLTLEGVGAFPSPARPRVVWTGATEGSAELVTLANDVRAALAHEGDPTRREATFVPHLTLFRVRSANDVRRAHELLAGRIPLPTPRRFRVAEFVLKESELSTRGATHRTVRTFPLSGRAPVPP